MLPCGIRVACEKRCYVCCACALIGTGCTIEETKILMSIGEPELIWDNTLPLSRGKEEVRKTTAFDFDYSKIMFRLSGFAHFLLCRTLLSPPSTNNKPLNQSPAFSAKIDHVSWLTLI